MFLRHFNLPNWGSSILKFVLEIMILIIGAKQLKTQNWKETKKEATQIYTKILKEFMQREPFQLLLSLLLLFLADGLPGFSSLFVYMKNRKEPNQAQFLSRETSVSTDLSPHSWEEE